MSYAPLGAQVTRDTTRKRDTVTVPVPAPPDSAFHRDSTARDTSASIVPLPTDTTRARKDTIAAPLARAEAIASPEVAGRYEWDRDALFASGALTLLDLLAHVPGVTAFQTGWISTPQVASYLGNPGRVRLFLDGLELVPLDPSSGNVLDLATVPLWPWEQVRVERGADELRVYLRSWTVRRTTPYSRADVYTGTEDTNIFRGFFGRRYPGGWAFQVGAQQYGTQTPRSGAGGDMLSILGRTGWARGRWSVDGFMLRTSRTRDAEQAFGQPPLATLTDSIPARSDRRTQAYLRAGYGDPDAGPWAQLLAGTTEFTTTHEDNTSGTTTGGAAPARPDTSRIRAQYVAAAGLSRWGVRFSVTDRLHVFDLRDSPGGPSAVVAVPLHPVLAPTPKYERRVVNTLSGRAAFERGWAAIDGYAERAGTDSTSRVEVVARLAPLPFLSIAGAASAVDDGRSGMAGRTNSVRGELGLRLGGLWLSGGVLRREANRIAVPLVFNLTSSAAGTTPERTVPGDRVTGFFATARGHLIGPLHADAWFVGWDSAGLYRPKYQARSEVYLSSSWLSRFPSGNFHVLAAGIHDFRSATPFLRADGGRLWTLNNEQSISFLLEIRIVNAVLTYEARNPTGAIYDVVPGYLAPRNAQYYGVRWDFWN